MRDLRLTGLDWSFVLRPGVNRAGRSVENELHLHESSVSGFHCEIHVSERMILVKDLGSTNGTFVDGKPVQESAILPGQVLRLGFVELQLEEQAVEISIPALNFDQPGSSVALPDGTRSCANHPTVQATLWCPSCERVFCEACVHFLRLTGGKTRLFCPSCSNSCEPIPGIRPGKLRKRSLLSRLTQTLLLRFR